MRVVRKNLVLAESDDTIVIEGNHYFPPDSVRWEYFRKSDRRTTCAWKGEARYHHIIIDQKVERDGAWYYPDPKDAAAKIKNYLAFYKGVEASP